MNLRRLTTPCALALLLAAAPVAGQQVPRFALGAGAGMVDADGAEPYLTASLRIRLGELGEVDRRGLVAFVEPEVGGWQGSGEAAGGLAVDEEDLHVGVNVGALVMRRSVETFVGAGVAHHLLDRTLVATGTPLGGADDSLGFNAHAGLDWFLSDVVSLFALLRVDVVEERDEDRQTKVVVGARWHF